MSDDDLHALSRARQAWLDADRRAVEVQEAYLAREVPREALEDARQAEYEAWCALQDARALYVWARRASQ